MVCMVCERMACQGYRDMIIYWSAKAASTTNNPSIEWSDVRCLIFVSLVSGCHHHHLFTLYSSVYYPYTALAISGASTPRPVVVQPCPGYSLSSWVWRAIWIVEQDPHQNIQQASSIEVHRVGKEEGISYFWRIWFRTRRPTNNIMNSQ